jgi:hypothetical protein
MADELTVDYLGRSAPTSFKGQPALPVGGPSAPTPTTAAGTTGAEAPGGGTLGGGGGKGGAAGGGSPLSMIMDALRGARTINDLLNVREDLGTRGNIGGEGTPQTSPTSLSDRLRTLGVTGATELSQLTPEMQAALTEMLGAPSAAELGGGAQALTGADLAQLQGLFTDFPSLAAEFPGALGSAADVGAGALTGATGAIEGAGAGAVAAGTAAESVGAPLVASLGATAAESGIPAALTTGAGTLGGMAAGGLVTAVAYPYIQAIINGLSQMFGLGMSEQESNKLANTMKEAERNIGNAQRVLPVIGQGAGLPDSFAAAKASGDTNAILSAVETAKNITDQGAALSQIQPGIKGWGPFKNPYAGNEQLSQAMSQNMRNAYQVYLEGMKELSDRGLLTPYAGEDENLKGTYTVGGKPLFGGSSPIAPGTIAGAYGEVPSWYTERFYPGAAKGKGLGMGPGEGEAAAAAAPDIGAALAGGGPSFADIAQAVTPAAPQAGAPETGGPAAPGGGGAAMAEEILKTV